MAEEPMQKFAANMSSQVLIITVVVYAMLVIVGGLLVVLAWKARDRGVASWGLGLGGLVTLGLAVLFTNFKIRDYEISDHKMIVHQGLSRKVFSLQDLVEARLEPQEFRGAIRRWGMGGVWGFSGYFSSQALGKFQAYVTDPQRAVLVRWTDRQVVVSPIEPQKFIDTLLKFK
jgi:hypothetical protein